MKRRILFVMSLLLTAAVLIAIFCFSAQPASQSNGVSKKLAEMVVKWMSWFATKYTIRQRNYILRKLAHFTLYFLLGCGLTGLLRTGRKTLPAITAVPIGAVCAVLDEWHQSFVPGRSPQLRDIGLDTCGVAAAVVLLLLIPSHGKRGDRPQKTERTEE